MQAARLKEPPYNPVIPPPISRRQLPGLPRTRSKPARASSANA